jgi:1-acyl-sn-glycerol-3-phosphate acyltransferase
MRSAVCLAFFGSSNATLLIARRLITIPAVFLLTALATAALPVLLIAASLLSLFTVTRGALATFCFLYAYLWCEVAGILACFYAWLRYRRGIAFLNSTYRIQAWWTNALKSLAERLFRLKFSFENTEALNGPAAIVIPRHTSIADTIIPMACYALPRNLRMRYVLKRELLIDPCLDIAGNRLPNLFINRQSADGEAARTEVAELMKDIQEDEGALIYPEGTRYSRRKHQAIADKFSDNAEIQAQIRRWPLLLPPRLGGTMAMLQANPGKDVLFCAHSGFEGSSHFSNLINGAWLSANVRIYFWRVRFAEIPTDPAELKNWLFSQWDTMHDWVQANQRGTGAGEIV